MVTSLIHANLMFTPALFGFCFSTIILSTPPDDGIENYSIICITWYYLLDLSSHSDDEMSSDYVTFALDVGDREIVKVMIKQRLF